MILRRDATANFLLSELPKIKLKPTGLSSNSRSCGLQNILCGKRTQKRHRKISSEGSGFLQRLNPLSYPSALKLQPMTPKTQRPITAGKIHDPSWCHYRHVNKLDPQDKYYLPNSIEGVRREAWRDSRRKAKRKDRGRRRRDKYCPMFRFRETEGLYQNTGTAVPKPSIQSDQIPKI